MCRDHLISLHRHLDSSCHNDPCLSNPCLANGTCHAIPSSSNYTCSCPESVTGKRCESSGSADSPSSLSREFAWNDDDNSQRDHSTELWPLAIVFGYVFSLMLVFIIIWFLWWVEISSYWKLFRFSHSGMVWAFVLGLPIVLIFPTEIVPRITINPTVWVSVIRCFSPIKNIIPVNFSRHLLTRCVPCSFSYILEKIARWIDKEYNKDVL